MSADSLRLPKLDCPPGRQPSVGIVKGRHPTAEKNFHASEFIPNTLQLGPQENHDNDAARMLLLSDKSLDSSLAPGGIS
jgi:DNA mismatch repair ATPase MutS